MEIKRESLFISYSWNDGNVYADELENQLSDYFDVKRDKTQLKYNDDMYDFMSEIANCDYVVVILSASYVKSVNCMLEASYLVQQPDWAEKALVLVIDESIYSTERKLELLKYWHDRRLTSEYKDCELGRSIVEEDLRNIEEIDDNLEKFLYGISRKRNPTQIAIVNEFVRKSRDKKAKDNDPIILGLQKVKQYIDTHESISLPELSEAVGYSPAFTSRLVKGLMNDADKDPLAKESLMEFLAKRKIAGKIMNEMSKKSGE